MNPFTFGNPIKDPARFIGRRAEIRQIVNRLLTSAHESTSIIGERRIGKTSLLNYLSNREVATSFGLPTDQFCLIYVDFQGLTDITPQRFWERVLMKLARSICDKSLLPAIQGLSKLEQFDLFDLEDLFEAITDKGLTTVLFMDEFEYVTQNPNFKSDFFGGLRALAIHHGVALVPATRRELVDLCHSEEIKGSPFFNIFANVVLRPFTRLEVDEMICTYLQDAEFPCSPGEQDFIWKLGGGYPFFVQMAGYYLLEGKLQNLDNEALTTFAATNFDQQAEAHFSYLWSRCSESEKITLIITLTLCIQKQSKKTIPNLENLTRLRTRAPQDVITLSKRGLLAEQQGIYALFSPSFERWIRREIMALPGGEENEQSAEEWLKSGSGENFKNARSVLPGIKKKYWHMIADVAKDLSIEFAASGAFEIVRALIVASI